MIIPLPFVFLIRLGRRREGYPSVERVRSVDTQDLGRGLRRAGWFSTFVSVFVSVLASLFLTGLLLRSCGVQ
jgi:hypothetical protein